MMVPVRCFTCGTVVGSAYTVYKKQLEAGAAGQDALEATGLERFCCRRMLVAHVDLLKASAPYE